MIEIIRKGEGPSRDERKKNRLYKNFCWNCHTIFKYNYSDIEHNYYGCDMPHIVKEVKCPVCNKYVSHTIFTKRIK